MNKDEMLQDIKWLLNTCEIQEDRCSYLEYYIFRTDKFNQLKEKYGVS